MKDKELPKDPMEFALHIVGWASTIMQPVMDTKEGQKIAQVIAARLEQQEARLKPVEGIEDVVAWKEKARIALINAGVAEVVYGELFPKPPNKEGNPNE